MIDETDYSPFIKMGIKVFVPDPCTPWRLVSLATGHSYGYADEVLIDVGLRAAIGGVSISTYVKFVQRVKINIRAEVYYVVVPDVYGDSEKTYRNWVRYSKVLSRYGRLVYVAQGFVVPGDWGSIEPELVALPSRSQNGVSCSRNPVYCVENITNFIDRYGAEFNIHLLGPAKPVLSSLGRMGYLDYVTSIDTSAYRKSGERLPRRGDKSVCALLKKWLEDIPVR
jgi:hypothetical protein